MFNTVIIITVLLYIHHFFLFLSTDNATPSLKDYE